MSKKKSAKKRKRSRKGRDGSEKKEGRRAERQEEGKEERKRESGEEQKEAQRREQSEERKGPETPGEDTREKKSASGLFKEAIAAFASDYGGVGAPPTEKREAGEEESEAAEEVGKEVKQAERAEEVEEAGEVEEAERIGEAEEVGHERPGSTDFGELSRAAHARPVEEPRRNRLVAGREAQPLTSEAAPTAASADRQAAEDRIVRKLVRKRSEPDEEIEAYEPTEYEVHGDVIKFECRCGKRVSAPLGAKHSVGKCPRCGVRLVLPGPGRAARGVGGTAAAGPRLSDDQAGASGVRLSADTAASWISRLVAFQVDLGVPAALFFAVLCLLKRLQVDAATFWTTAVAVAGGAWLVVAIVFPSVVSASLGMLAAGLRYRGPDGGPLSFTEAVGRAAAGVLLSPLAPLSLADPRGRTTADHVTGCVVVGAGEPPLLHVDRGARGTAGKRDPEGVAKERHAQDTPRKRHGEARRGRKKPR